MSDAAVESEEMMTNSSDDGEEVVMDEDATLKAARRKKKSDKEQRKARRLREKQAALAKYDETMDWKEGELGEETAEAKKARKRREQTVLKHYQKHQNKYLVKNPKTGKLTDQIDYEKIHCYSSSEYDSDKEQQLQLLGMYFTIHSFTYCTVHLLMCTSYIHRAISNGDPSQDWT
jgi:hypothetical protein